MLDDFIARALLAGIGLAIIAGPLGCFIIWRRMAYFGDTLAHSALLGVVAGIFLDINITLTVFVVSAVISCLMILLRRSGTLSSDAILGLLSHSGLALGLVAISFLSQSNVSLNSLLFGDILGVSKQDVGIIYIGGTVLLIILVLIWRPLFAATVSQELSEAEMKNPNLPEIIFMLLMAAVIALAMKIVGVLLITAMLIVPAATARKFSVAPEQMVVISILIGILSVSGGVAGSLQFDTPTAPTIVVASLILFILSRLSPRMLRAKRNE
ncbi:metal ABC transporter permease [Ahrensia sp. 13_GOM-1096m]|uniref:metal ABC transporter permease n=1 Tax=Ahrensia sp. 13_GOM-1096m TaxID=1380380 RepID=UPI000479E573|nr:metal ABC transporter permease [Ahrensia sp. 13_GOM-1096m]